MPMPMLARMDATATEPTNGSAAAHRLAEVEVDAPVADVLHGLHQRRLQQERAEHAERSAR